MEEAETVEYWAGNPSVEIIHGHIKVSRAADTEAAGSSSGKPEACMVLASSVPCHMSAPEFCDFLGAFGPSTHRRFRHCRVLHGKNSEEYLIALLMATPQEFHWRLTTISSPAAPFGFSFLSLRMADRYETQDVQWLIDDFHGKSFNAIEPGVCNLHFVWACQTGPLLEDSASPNTFGRRWSPVPQHADRPMVREPCPSTPFMLPSASHGYEPPAPSPSPPPPELPELFVGTGAGTQSVVSPTPTASAGERPFCAVCLETVDSNPSEYQLTELGGGVPLTILCGHTFHARCLSRWCDTTCPVCRFQQHPYQTSSCDVCGQAEGVHICLVCGFIGCTAPQGEGHALQHFESSSHAYALDVNTQHVWDYAGNGYVHRLLFNDSDGKMVEHTVPAADGGAAAAGLTARSVFGDVRWADMEDDDCEKIAALFTRASAASSSSSNTKKQDNTAQREHFDELRQDIEKQCATELSELSKQKADEAQRQLTESQEELKTLEQKIAQAVADEALAQRQRSQLEQLNQRLSQEQRAFEDRQDTAAEKKKSGRQLRDRRPGCTGGVRGVG
eukprot:g25906.t1